jgi:hypothetical protein
VIGMTVRLLASGLPPLIIRGPEEVAAMIGGDFELVPPGVAPATDWHPDPDEADDLPQPTALVAVARKR